MFLQVAQVFEEGSVFKGLHLELIKITVIVGIIVTSASSFIKEHNLRIFYRATGISSPGFYLK